jgi:hypothetical protein
MAKGQPAMNKYAIANLLEDVAMEGRSLTWTGPGEDRQRVLVWFARSADTLGLFLAADSELRKLFSDIRNRFIGDPSASVLQEAVNLIKVAWDVNRTRKDDGMSNDLRQDVQAVIAETYLKSWWFRSTMAALTVTVIFAAVGVFQINNIRVDVHDRAETALKKAEQEINDQKASAARAITSVGEDAKREVANQLKSQLQSHVDETKRNITAAAQAHLDELKRQKTPELEAALLMSRSKLDAQQKRLEATEGRLSRLEAKADALTRAIEHISKATTGAGALDKLSAFLDRSKLYVVTEIATLITAAVLSAIAMLLVLAQRRKLQRQ